MHSRYFKLKTEIPFVILKFSISIFFRISLFSNFIFNSFAGIPPITEYGSISYCLLTREFEATVQKDANIVPFVIDTFWQTHTPSPIKTGLVKELNLPVWGFDVWWKSVSLKETFQAQEK